MLNLVPGKKALQVTESRCLINECSWVADGKDSGIADWNACDSG